MCPPVWLCHPKAAHCRTPPVCYCCWAMEKDPALRLRVFDLNCWWVLSLLRLCVWKHLP